MGRASRRREEQSREERTAKRSREAVPFRDFVETIKRACEGDYKGLALHADPVPKAVYESASGHRSLVAFDGRFMASDDTKDQLTALLVGGVKAHRAVKLSWQTAAWMANLEPDEDIDDPQFKQAGERPDKIEVVQLIVCDAERTEGWIAQVVRTDSVFLGPWNHPSVNPDFTGEPLVEMAGRFIDPIQEAMR